MSQNPRNINTEGGDYREVLNKGLYSEGDIQIFLQKIEASKRSNTEKLLLQQVAAEVASRLRQSLHSQVFIDLDKEELLTQVQRSWDYEIKLGKQNNRHISSEESLIKIFTSSNMQGRLLILGEPGTGKTTNLLNLAGALLEVAQDPDELIPVILNLSSWSNGEEPISIWLTKEIKRKYGVALSVGEQWLEEQKLLPLLDGLDEVSNSHQKDCVRSINQWISGNAGSPSPIKMVVCSRREEYKRLKTKLKLNGAVCLNKLSEEMIENYLHLVDRAELLTVIHANTSLRELVSVPLFLSMLVIAYQDSHLDSYNSKEGKNAESYLIGSYVNYMLERAEREREKLKQEDRTSFNKDELKRLDRKTKIISLYSTDQTKSWLCWIASKMETNGTTEFLVEDLQPSWLERKATFQMYRFQVWFIAVLIIFVLNGTAYFLQFGAISALRYVAIFSTFIVGLDLLSLNEIIPVDAISFSWNKALKEYTAQRNKGRLAGLWLGSVAVLVTYSIATPALSIAAGVVIGAISSIFFRILIGVSSGLNGYEVEEKILVNQGIRNALKLGLTTTILSFAITSSAIGTIVLAIGGASAFLDGGYNFTVNISLLVAVLFGLSQGVSASIKHLSLRYSLYREGLAPWDYEKFLTRASECMLLQQVGGQFRFIHKTVQRHFATMATEETQ